MIVGFTGTQTGMTTAQRAKVLSLLSDFSTVFGEAHHGMCIGADAEFHHLAQAVSLRTVGHPGVNKKGEAKKRATLTVDEEKVEKFYLTRNRDIVAAVEVMIATPGEVDEVLIGSGTWATIRYARKALLPLVIVWPDGSVLEERME